MSPTIPHSDETPRSIDLMVHAVRYTPRVNLGRENTMELYKHVLNDLLAGERTFVLDFSGNPYVDGRALEKLKQMSQRIVELRGKLTIENANEDLFTLLTLTHFDRLFVIKRAGES